jgi:hypothetical protein
MNIVFEVTYRSTVHQRHCRNTCDGSRSRRDVTPNNFTRINGITRGNHLSMAYFNLWHWLLPAVTRDRHECRN